MASMTGLLQQYQTAAGAEGSVKYEKIGQSFTDFERELTEIFSTNINNYIEYEGMLPAFQALYPIWGSIASGRLAYLVANQDQTNFDNELMSAETVFNTMIDWIDDAKTFIFDELDDRIDTANCNNKETLRNILANEEDTFDKNYNQAIRGYLADLLSIEVRNYTEKNISSWGDDIGTWSDFVRCPFGEYVIGIDIAIYDHDENRLQSGITARLFCSGDSETPLILSNDIPSAWNEKTINSAKCPSDESIVGFTTYYYLDISAVRIACAKDSQFLRYELGFVDVNFIAGWDTTDTRVPWSKIGNFAPCDREASQAVCGGRQRTFQTGLGSILSDIELVCCSKIN